MRLHIRYNVTELCLWYYTFARVKAAGKCIYSTSISFSHLMLTIYFIIFLDIVMEMCSLTMTMSNMG
ncbi:Uncharacterized protein TCM_034528 [Theobroma cacao]|uniref:Uncharacterized protein n=1 Tax=Theobroma cacao TaxID=3641 RepID=A0A061FFH5_THECC|nr:Uncharacterized protein TCM_034528 [Theobroma cacao]